jgi:hypothetical protein
MAQIRIKRSFIPNSNPPTDLAPGELAVAVDAAAIPRLWVGVPAETDADERRLIVGDDIYLPLTGGTLSNPGNLNARFVLTEQGFATYDRVTPALSWAIYAADGLRFNEGGVDRLTIAGDGNLTIAGVGINYDGAPGSGTNLIGFGWDGSAHVGAWVDGIAIGWLATTAELTGYLPLTGGTLTGALNVIATIQTTGSNASVWYQNRLDAFDNWLLYVTGIDGGLDSPARLRIYRGGVDLFTFDGTGTLTAGGVNIFGQLYVDGAIIASPVGVGSGTNLFGATRCMPGGSLTVDGPALFHNRITGNASISLGGVGSNTIDWNAFGVAPPSAVTRSVGTKLALYPSFQENIACDYGLGIDSGTLWYAGGSHRWYNVSGPTEIMSLDGRGNLGVAGEVVPTNAFRSSIFAQSFTTYNFQANAYPIGEGLWLYHRAGSAGMISWNVIENAWSFATAPVGNAGAAVAWTLRLRIHEHDVRVAAGSSFSVDGAMDCWSSTFPILGPSGQPYAGLTGFSGHLVPGAPHALWVGLPKAYTPSGANQWWYAVLSDNFFGTYLPPYPQLQGGALPLFRQTRNVPRAAWCEAIRLALGDEAVIDSDGEVLVEHGRLIVALWQAVQELTAELDRLKGRRR